MHIGCAGGMSGVRLRGDVSGAKKITSDTLSVLILCLCLSLCLEMSMKIENLTSCEIWSVIKVFYVKNVRPAEIYQQVCEVCGENAISDGMVRRWCRMFSEGSTNVHGDDRSGRPSLVTADLLDQVNEKIRENRPCTQ
jgi:hypothetical protein